MYYLAKKMRNINTYNRIVIKIGSAVLSASNGMVNHKILAAISEDIAWLLKNDKEEIGRAHVRTPVTEKSRMPSSA